MPRIALLLPLCLLALAAAGCGGDDEDPEVKAARKSAEAYVHDLGSRDGEGVAAAIGTTAPAERQG